MESNRDGTKGQWHRGAEWIPEENLTSSCALSSDQLQSQLRHFWCPSGEVQAMINRGFHLSTSSNNCSRAAGVSQRVTKTVIIRLSGESSS